MKPEENLERFIQEYGDMVLRICYLYLKDYHLAEDATQDVFIKVMKSYDTFEDRSSEKTWLISITINVCKNIMRNAWFKFPKCLFNKEVEYINHESFTDQIIKKNTVMNAIFQLNTSDREIIILYYYQELSIKEIAQIIGKKENTTIQRLNRARQRLKKILTEVEYNV